MTGKNLLRMGAPIIAAGGVWLAQQAISGGYKAVAGAPPPKADDLEAPMTRVLVYAAGAAVVAAVINVLISREDAKATAPDLEEASTT